MRLQSGYREDDTCRGMRIDMTLKHGIVHMRMWHGKKGVLWRRQNRNIIPPLWLKIPASTIIAVRYRVSGSVNITVVTHVVVTIVVRMSRTVALVTV